MGVQISLWVQDFVSFDTYPVVGLLDHMVVIFIIIWGTSILFSIVAVPVYISIMCPRVPSSPHPCQHLLTLVFLIIDILTGVRWHLLVVWFVFPWWMVMLSIFSCTCWPFVHLLWRNIYLSSLPVLKLDYLYFYYFFFNKFIYLFLAVLGLCCCVWAFSSCGERRLLLIAVHGLLIAVGSVAVEHGL